MNIDQRAILAAHNNADWYEAMFTSHNLRFDRRSYAFIGHDKPPPYYSNLTILDPSNAHLVPQELSKLAQTFDGALGLKDSFCLLELKESGFEVLFEASWIWRQPEKTSMPNGWDVVSNGQELQDWEKAWKHNGSPTDQRIFPESLLSRSDVFFLGRKEGNKFTAGCIANTSDDCIGLSNVFAETPSQNSFIDAANATSSIASQKPVVGYESGADLGLAMSSNFQSVGKLRILVTRCAQF